jgi:hypothetical protein
MAQSYYDYSALVLATTMIAVGSSVYETRKVYKSYYYSQRKHLPQ